MGYRILAHSIRLVFLQWREAVRISALLYILSSVLSVALFTLSPPVPEQPGISWPMFLASLVMFFSFMWIAVGWHRYVLLDEPPTSFLPQFRSDRILAYFGYTLLTGLISGAVAFAVMLFLGLISALFSAPWILMIGAAVVFILIMIIAYRLAPVFPSAALGQKTSIGAAWSATRGATGTFILLGVISVIASIVIDLPAIVLAMLPLGGVLSLLWLTATGWAKTMVAVSLLTTIYGHYVEGRPIR